MNNCIKGMSDEEVYMELTKDDMGKCNGCEYLQYSNGIMTCKCMKGDK